VAFKVEFMMQGREGAPEILPDPVAVQAQLEHITLQVRA
jgi:hypothetical protein